MTTFNEAFGRVAMHGVRMDLVEQQASAASLPLLSVPLPWPCSNEVYERRMAAFIEQAAASNIEHIAFGDLHLAEIRDYRERQLEGTGIGPLFPIWGAVSDTPHLARQMIAAGVRAKLTCVDPKQLDPSFIGREFDNTLLADFPSTVDPCGERGEFHTFCYSGPMFDKSIPTTVGETVERDGFCFIDLLS